MQAITQEIIGYVELYGQSTLSEIATFLREKGFNVDGLQTFRLAENVIVWQNMSQEFVGAMEQIMLERLLIPHFDIANQYLCYLADGRVPPLPVIHIGDIDKIFNQSLEIESSLAVWLPLMFSAQKPDAFDLKKAYRGDN